MVGKVGFRLCETECMAIDEAIPVERREEMRGIEWMKTVVVDEKMEEGEGKK